MTLKTHIALNTSDFDRSLAFYRAFFGQDPVKSREGYAKFDLDNPGLNLTLNARSQREANEASETSEADVATPNLPRKEQNGPRDLNHLGIQVGSTAEVDAAAQRLKDAGLATWDERDTDCCYALQDKVWVQDPDGNGWEIFVVKVADTGAEAPTPKQASGVVAACCGVSAGTDASGEGACCAT